MLRWLCIIVNLVDFVVWMVRIVTYVLRMVHIRKLSCILEDSQLMELGTRIKGEVGTCIKVELGTRQSGTQNSLRNQNSHRVQP